MKELGDLLQGADVEALAEPRTEAGRTTENNVVGGYYASGLDDPRASIRREAEAATKPDAAVAFDPTNHHNAAKCPYCSPPDAVGAVAGLPHCSTCSCEPAEK